MALHRNSIAILQLLMLCIESFCLKATKTVFIIEPYDVKQVFPYESSLSVNSGLSCGVQHLQTDSSVAWYKNMRQISNNDSVYGNVVDRSRYRVEVTATSTRARFNLQIATSAASADSDSGKYHCRVMTKPPVISLEARFDVFVTPQYGYLRCSIGDDPGDDDFDVSEGTEIRLSCHSDPTGVPEMTTYWTGKGPQDDTFDILTTTSTDIKGVSRVLSFSWTPTKQQTGVTFTCTGIHPGYNTNRRCQLGPFNVLYRPIVQLFPSYSIVTMETQAVTFTCIADANPPVTRYVWGNTVGEKFSVQGDNAIVGPYGIWMQMKNFGSQDNGVYNVTCYAENEVGRSFENATSTLNVNLQAWTTVTIMNEHLSTTTSALTANGSKGNEHITSDGQHDMTGKTSKTNSAVIIGSIIGSCSFILAVIVVVLITCTVRVRKSRRKSPKNESADTRVSAGTNSVFLIYEEISDVSSPCLMNTSQYSTVDQPYEIVNDNGNTPNVDYTSVKITAQAGMLFKNADGSRGETMQSLVEPRVVGVGKQGESISTIAAEDTENKQTETRNKIYVINEDIQQKSETGRNRPAENSEAEYIRKKKTETKNPPIPSQYSTVDQSYEIVNDFGNTSNVDSTSVEITAQTGVLFNNTDGNRGDTLQSLVEPSLVRVGKQGNSISPITSEDTENKKIETRKSTNPSQYPTVDQTYEIVNDDRNTSNGDSTSVEMTAQAGVLSKNSDGNREETIQSLVVPCIVRVAKQRKAVSSITAEETENKKTETSDGIYMLSKLMKTENKIEDQKEPTNQLSERSGSRLKTSPYDRPESITNTAATTEQLEATQNIDMDDEYQDEKNRQQTTGQTTQFINNDTQTKLDKKCGDPTFQ